jgi:MFS superfamily sulfate permease-like transporter
LGSTCGVALVGGVQFAVLAWLRHGIPRARTVHELFSAEDRFAAVRTGFTVLLAIALLAAVAAFVILVRQSRPQRLPAGVLVLAWRVAGLALVVNIGYAWWLVTLRHTGGGLQRFVEASQAPDVELIDSAVRNSDLGLFVPNGLGLLLLLLTAGLHAALILGMRPRPA